MNGKGAGRAQKNLSETWEQKPGEPIVQQLSWSESLLRKSYSEESPKCCMFEIIQRFLAGVKNQVRNLEALPIVQELRFFPKEVLELKKNITKAKCSQRVVSLRQILLTVRAPTPATQPCHHQTHSQTRPKLKV